MSYHSNYNNNNWICERKFVKTWIINYIYANIYAITHPGKVFYLFKSCLTWSCCNSTANCDRFFRNYCRVHCIQRTNVCCSESNLQVLGKRHITNYLWRWCTKLNKVNTFLSCTGRLSVGLISWPWQRYTRQIIHGNWYITDLVM